MCEEGAEVAVETPISYVLGEATGILLVAFSDVSPGSQFCALLSCMQTSWETSGCA